MIRFVDGPIAGQTLVLTRAPLWLRAVVNRSTGEIDALDKIEDEPTELETIHVYRRCGLPQRVHLYFGGSRGRWGLTAEYRLAAEQPPGDVAYQTSTWQRWARQQRRTEAETATH